MSVRSGLAAVRERLQAALKQAGRPSDDARLVAISKMQPSQAVREAYDLGQRVFGENYIQEASAKIAEVGPGPVWHLTGRLQTNKAKAAVSLFSMIQSLHSLELAAALEKQCAAQNRRLEVLIQVNLSGETQKSGCRPEETLPLALALLGMPHLQLRGLMTMPPFFDEPEKARPYFAQLRMLKEKLAPELPKNCMDELSMGMSGDFEAAVAEGATLVRVGSAIFGERA